MRKFCARVSMLWHWSASGWLSGLYSLQHHHSRCHPVITLFRPPPSSIPTIPTIPTGPLVCTIVCKCSSSTLPCICTVHSYVECFITSPDSFFLRVNNLCHISRFHLVLKTPSSPIHNTPSGCPITATYVIKYTDGGLVDDPTDEAHNVMAVLGQRSAHLAYACR